MRFPLAILSGSKAVLPDGTIPLANDDEVRWVFLGHRRLVNVPVRVTDTQELLVGIKVLDHQMEGWDVPPVQSHHTLAKTSLFFPLNDQYFRTVQVVRWVHYGIENLINVPARILGLGNDVARIQVLRHTDKRVGSPQVGHIALVNKASLFLPAS